MSLSDTLRSGDYRAALEALRDHLADSLDAAKPGERAGLARQLADVLKTLEGLAKPKGSKVDEIAQRRAARRGSEVPDGTGRVGRSGPGGGRTRAGRRTGS